MAQHNQDYIQLWHGDASLLRESLEAVQQTAAVILGAIGPEVAGGRTPGAGMPQWLDDGLRFMMETMADEDKVWIAGVRLALSSINMSMDDWQSIWPFDFQAEYKAGAKADDAAMKANRFWWREQNRSLKKDCRLTTNCWLPYGHQGDCQPVNSDSHGNRPTASYDQGDYVKVEFPDEATGIGEWMWVRITQIAVTRRSSSCKFGVLDTTKSL